MTPASRALLGQLDGECCRFPGCTRSRSLHAHHIRYWPDGGRTDLANLALVCSRHHTLIHTQGFRLTLHHDRRLTVTRSDGRPVERLPQPPWLPREELAGAHDGTPQTRSNGDLLDLRHVAWVLTQHAA